MRFAVVCFWTCAGTACIPGGDGECTEDDEGDVCRDDAPLCNEVIGLCVEAECQTDAQCRAEAQCRQGQRCADAVHGNGGENGACVFVATACDGDAVLTPASPAPEGGALIEFCGDAGATCESFRCAP